jgi:hypothetical protein
MNSYVAAHKVADTVMMAQKLTDTISMSSVIAQETVKLLMDSAA